LTPKGDSINGVGVKPDIVEERSEKYIKESTRENDNQLKKAIEVIKSKKESN
jgi:C-terminal processing protease CtpA/Prc